MELDPFVERFAATISGVVVENLHAGVSVGELADAAGYSPFHFSRLFARVFRTSPAQYVAAVRFQKAKELLLVHDYPVIDVCHEVGFNSVSTFSRRFSQAVAVAPGQMRMVADSLAETEIPAFTMAGPGKKAGTVTGQVVFAPDLRRRLRDDLVHREPLVWIGTYAHPVPLGRPATGVLRHGEGRFELPVTANAPWVLATAYPASADPLGQLAAPSPLVGMHPGPVAPGDRITLSFRQAKDWEHPVLTALPALAQSPSS